MCQPGHFVPGQVGLHRKKIWLVRVGGLVGRLNEMGIKPTQPCLILGLGWAWQYRIDHCGVIGRYAMWVRVLCMQCIYAKLVVKKKKKTDWLKYRQLVLLAKIKVLECIQEPIKMEKIEWATKLVILAWKPVGFQNMWISAKSNQQVKENVEHF